MKYFGSALLLFAGAAMAHQEVENHLEKVHFNFADKMKEAKENMAWRIAERNGRGNKKNRAWQTAKKAEGRPHTKL